MRHPISRETHVANKFTDLVFEITALKSTQKIVLWVLAHRADESGTARHIQPTAPWTNYWSLGSSTRRVISTTGAGGTTRWNTS